MCEKIKKALLVLYAMKNTETQTDSVSLDDITSPRINADIPTN